MDTAIRSIIDVDVIKDMVDPGRADGKPVPALYVQAEVDQNVRILGNFTVTASGSPVNGIIGSERGLVTWHVLKGAGIVCRWAYVRSGRALTITSPFFPGNSITSLNLSWTQDQWVSYVDTQDNQPTISPDLSQYFSQVRFQYGHLKLISTTRPGGTFDFSGTLHGGSWSDTRDGWQTINGAVTPSDIVTMSVTEKDGINNVDPLDGLLAVGACDVGSHYIVPNPDLVRKEANRLVINPGINAPNYNPSSSLQNNPGSGYYKTGSPSAAQVLGYSSNPISLDWFSPWGISASAASTGPIPIWNTFTTSNFGNYHLPNTSCYGQVSFRVEVSVDLLYANVADLGVKINTHLVAYDIFGYVAEGVSPVNLICDSTTQTIVKYSVEPRRYVGSTANATQFAPTVINHRSSLAPRVGLTYLGTLFQLTVDFPTSTATAGNIDPTFNIAYLPIYEDFAGDGDLGPVRLLQWEDFQAGQTLSLTGSMRYSALSNGSLAPYVSPTAISDPRSSQLQWLIVANMLFNGGDHRFKRIYVTSEHERVCEELRNLSIHDFRLDAPTPLGQSIPIEAKQVISASGLMDVVGKTFANVGAGALQGGLAGMLTGDPVMGLTGAALGGLAGLGGIPPHAMAPRAAGMMPSSAGMYGEVMRPSSAGLYTPNAASGSLFGHSNPTTVNQPIRMTPAGVAQQLSAARNLMQAAGMMPSSAGMMAPEATARFSRSKRYRGY